MTSQCIPLRDDFTFHNDISFRTTTNEEKEQTCFSGVTEITVGVIVLIVGDFVLPLIGSVQR